MIVPKPLRVVGIVACGFLLAAPALVCFRGMPSRPITPMGVIQALYLLWITLLVQLSIDEGREREHKRAERARQAEKQ